MQPRKIVFLRRSSYSRNTTTHDQMAATKAIPYMISSQGGIAMRTASPQLWHLKSRHGRVIQPLSCSQWSRSLLQPGQASLSLAGLTRIASS